MRPTLRVKFNWFGWQVYRDNVPLHWPGCYVIFRGGKPLYVGQASDIYRRLHSWGNRDLDKSVPMVQEVVKYGRAAFVVEPIFYLIHDPRLWFDRDKLRDRLLVYERGLITEFDTWKPFGFNIPESGRVIWTPERRQRLVASRRAYLADPENAKRHAETAKATVKRPDVRAKNSMGVSALVWITDGESSRRIRNSAPLPEGWQYGRVTNTRFGPEPGSITFQWITDGARNRHWPAGDVVPDGWRVGKVHKVKGRSQRRRSTANDNRKPVAPFTEERKQNISEGLRNYFTNEDPAAKAARSTRAQEQVTEHWKDPEYRENILASRATVREKTNQSLRNAWAHNHDERVAALHTPEYKAKLAARPVMARGTIWITDGFVNKRIPADQPIPGGWHKGTRPRNAKCG